MSSIVRASTPTSAAPPAGNRRREVARVPSRTAASRERAHRPRDAARPRIMPASSASAADDERREQQRAPGARDRGRRSPRPAGAPRSARSPHRVRGEHRKAGAHRLLRIDALHRELPVGQRGGVQRRRTSSTARAGEAAVVDDAAPARADCSLSGRRAASRRATPHARRRYVARIAEWPCRRAAARASARAAAMKRSPCSASGGHDLLPRRAAAPRPHEHGRCRESTAQASTPPVAQKRSQERRERVRRCPLGEQSLQRRTARRARARGRAHVLADAPDVLARHGAGELHARSALLVGQIAQHADRASRDDADARSARWPRWTGHQPPAAGSAARSGPAQRLQSGGLLEHATSRRR